MLGQELENIKNLFSKQQYELALDIAISAFKQNSDNNELKLELAKLYFIKQDYKKSEELFLDLQKNKDFIVVSTEMLQKTYKLISCHEKSLLQFYKLYKLKNINEYNIIDALDSSLFIKRYSTYIKVLNISKQQQIYNAEFVNAKIKDIYNKIIKTISNYNLTFDYKSVKILYRKIINYIPYTEKKIRNILLNEYEIATKEYVLKSKPRILTLELTNRCNLRCIMCEYKKIKKFWEISDDTFKELLNIMPYLEHLILQGGEVFLYKNIKQILETAIKENVSVEIVTNGLLLNEEIMKILIKGNNKITFSIDSIEKNIYEKIRVGGKLEILLNNLNKLFELKNKSGSNLILRLHMVVMKSNYKEIENIINFAGKYKFNEVYLEPVANKYICKEESIFEFGYDKEIVFELEQKRDIFNNLAKDKSLKLINHLPSVEFCNALKKDFYENNNTKLNKLTSLLWIFKKRQENNMNYNYSSRIYMDLNFDEQNIKYSDMFCYAPWHKLAIFDRDIDLPTCFCPQQFEKIMINPILENMKRKILNFIYTKKNIIMSKWNGKTMIYYRKSIICKKEKFVCAKDCLADRIKRAEREIVY